MNKLTKMLAEVLENDNLTKEFIDKGDDYLLNQMKKAINIKLMKVKKSGPKVKYIDAIYRITSIYNEFYKILFNEAKMVFKDKNLKLLKECYNYLKLREKVFKNCPELLQSKEKIVINSIETLFKNIQYYDNAITILKEYDEHILVKRELTEEEYKMFDDILLNHCFDTLPDSYINYYMYLILNYNYKIEPDTLKIVIINLGKNALKSYGINCNIIFKSMEDYGSFNGSSIILNDTLINQFIDTNCEDFSLLITLFHEIQHAIQDKLIKSKVYNNYTTLKMIKDNLFIDYMSQKEFNVNYYKFTVEVDAYNMELNWVYRYLKNIGVDEKKLKLRQQSMLVYNILYKTDNRIFKYKMLPLDILFDIYIKDIILFYDEKYNENIFEIYPLLKYIYTLDGTRKDTIQLLEEENMANENEKWIYRDIVNNQTISYIEIIKLLKKIKKTKYIDIILPLIKNRIKSSLRMVIDIYTFIEDNLTFNTEIILEEYRELLQKNNKTFKGPLHK